MSIEALVMITYHSPLAFMVSVTDTSSDIGKVFVDGKVVNKAGTPVSDKAVVEIKAEVPKYVCR